MMKMVGYKIRVKEDVAIVKVGREALDKVNVIANALYNMDKDINIVDVYDEDGEWVVTQFRNGR